MNKTVLITGSSIGIGRETAYKFAEAGYKVIVTYYKDREEGVKTVNWCRELGAPEAVLIRLNVADIQSVKTVFKKVSEEFGKIDILINNAGVGIWKNFKDLTEEELFTEIKVNLEGTVLMTKIFLPIIKETVINISSVLGSSVDSESAMYCASKWGVRGFTKAVALDIPEIKFYIVNPGSTATRMNNYQGVKPEKVAEVIFKTVEKNDLASGSEVGIT